jgi:hypothetical protein
MQPGVAAKLRLHRHRCLMGSSAPAAMCINQIRQGSIIPCLPAASNGIKGSQSLPHISSLASSNTLQLTTQGGQAALETRPPDAHNSAGVIRRGLLTKPILQTLEEGRGGEETKPQAAALAANSRGLPAK